MAKRRKIKVMPFAGAIGNSLLAIGGGFGANWVMDQLEGRVPWFARNPFAAPGLVYLGSLVSEMGMIKLPEWSKAPVKGMQVIAGVEVTKAAIDMFVKPTTDTAVSGKKTRFNAEINPVR